MLFHVTISHTEQDCPGRCPEEPLALFAPSERLEALRQELAVDPHHVVWSAACILWAKAEHVAFALLEAPNVDAALRYVRELTPAEWQVRTLPVFRLPEQMPLVHHVLTTPAVPGAQPATTLAPPASDDHGLPTRQVARLEASPLDVTAAEETTPAPTPTGRATPPAMPAIKPAAPAAPGVSDAVTRIVERPVLVPPDSDQDRASTVPPARGSSSASLTDLLESIDASNEQPEVPTSGGHEATETPSSREVTTLILAPNAAGQQQLRLLAVAGPAKNAVFEVGVDGATIGRLPENKIHLSDGRLSRLHARLEYQDGAFWIRDLGSANGTIVNGAMLSGAHRLTPGDSIEVGTSLLTVMDEPEADT
jgi:hypothetical protein